MQRPNVKNPAKRQKSGQTLVVQNKGSFENWRPTSSIMYKAYRKEGQSPSGHRWAGLFLVCRLHALPTTLCLRERKQHGVARSGATGSLTGLLENFGRRSHLQSSYNIDNNLNNYYKNYNKKPYKKQYKIILKPHKCRWWTETEVETLPNTKKGSFGSVF